MNYGAYADHLIRYIIFMKQNGVDLYAISVQNEPDMDFTYWTPQEVVDFVKQYGAKIRETGVRLMSPEACGTPPEYTDPIINEVQEGSPAEEAGLQPGDEIVALEAGGEVLRDMSTTRLNEQLQYYHDAAKLTVLRDGEEVSVNITPAYDEESKAWQIGAMLSARAEPITKLQAVGVATGQMGEYSTMIIRGIQDIVQGVGRDSGGGPVGI